jgi:hypothetical protein
MRKEKDNRQTQQTMLNWIVHPFSWRSESTVLRAVQHSRQSSWEVSSLSHLTSYLILLFSFVCYFVSSFCVLPAHSSICHSVMSVHHTGREWDFMCMCLCSLPVSPFLVACHVGLLFFLLPFFAR